MPTSANPNDRLVLVLGASGYVGGRLVPRLLEAGYRVRCLARSPQKLAGMPWAGDVEIVQGDLLDRDAIIDAFKGASAAFHLVHSMGSQTNFAFADRKIARHVARGAELAGVERLVYLGGLGEIDEHTSEHLRSRAEVGDILLDATVPVTVLRAAVVIGSGSASFEMIRHLVEKLPVMVTPRWVNTRTQPIAIRDVLRYLVGVLDEDSGDSHVFDIGGPDVMTYLEMMEGYARAAQLPKRLVVKVPVLTPRLSSLWVNLFTPVPYDLARPLIESLSNEAVRRPDSERIEELVPGDTLPYDEALRLALTRIHDHQVETSWRDADLAGRSPAEPYPGDPDWAGGLLLRDVREGHAKALPRHVFAAVSRVGGERGWPTFGWAWRWRGRLDRVFGGVGLRRGRRDPERLRVGDALDFWRVEELTQGGSDREWVIRLRAEFKAPGRAWLEFRISEDGEGQRPGERGSAIVQRALWAPKGLLGRLYWWVLLPIHPALFSSMLAAIVRDAEDIAAHQPEVDVAPDAEQSEEPARAG